MTRLNILIADIALVSMAAIAFVHTDAVAALLGITAIAAIGSVVLKKLQ